MRSSLTHGVRRRVLSNGLTVLVRPVHAAPAVNQHGPRFGVFDELPQLVNVDRFFWSLLLAWRFLATQTPHISDGQVEELHSEFAAYRFVPFLARAEVDNTFDAAAANFRLELRRS